YAERWEKQRGLPFHTPPDINPEYAKDFWETAGQLAALDIPLNVSLALHIADWLQARVETTSTTLGEVIQAINAVIDVGEDADLRSLGISGVVEIVGERFGLSEEEKAAIYGVVGDPYVAAFDLIRHRLNPTGTYGSWSPRTLGLPPPTHSRIV